MKSIYRNMALCGRAMIMLLMLVLSIGAMNASAQVTGTVVDPEGEPLTGATIMVVGTSVGTSADFDGNFSINAKSGQSLRVSSVGYETTVVKVDSENHIDIVLKENSTVLQDVVVVGYGTMEKKRVTSSITSIKGDNLISGLGGSTIATALQGKVSGLTISGSASPNASNGYQLRGVASVNAGKGPLVVIDGVPGGDLRIINQEDIESIDVLKDASAGAIYGTRAAAGVILVTTKRAKEGKTQVTYSMELSTESVRKHLDLLSSQEYTEYGLGQDYGYDTDWYKQLTNDHPFSQRHSLAINGGTKNLQLYSSFVYSDQKGIVIGDGRKDYSARLNGRYTMWDGRVEIGVRTQFREADRDNRTGSYSFQQALTLNPTIPMMNPEAPAKYNVSGYGLGSTTWNPVANIMLKKFDGKDKWFLGDATLKVTILDGLWIQGTMGIDQRQYQKYEYYNFEHRNSVTGNKRGKASHSFSKTDNKSFEAYATFMRDFNRKHRFDAVVGWSFWETNGEAFSMSNANFSVDGLGPWDMSAGTDLKDGEAHMSSSKDPRERLISVFGRANYSFDDRYMFTASYRREGSSKFGPRNRWGDFWSVSGGWRISREKFMENLTWINDLKLRVGYGITGNNDFGAGYTVRMYSVGTEGMWAVNGIWQNAYGTTINMNPDLKWEQKKELNVGIDYSFLNNRIYGKFDIYHRRVDDMLYQVPAPVLPMVHSVLMTNVGSLTNNGWEFEISGDIFAMNDFSWTSTLRMSHNTSKIDNLGTEDAVVLGGAFPASMGNASRIVNGSRIGEFWLFKHAGLDSDGKWLIYDKNNNIVPGTAENLNNDNKHYVGNGVPTLIMSMDNNFRYRNFDLGISLRSWIDYDVFSQLNLYHGIKQSSAENLLKIAYTDNAAINDKRILSDYFLSDGTFLKIDALTFGYTLNLSKYNKYLSKVRAYVTARDLYTWTKYKGYNPEVSINGLFPGFEYVVSTYTMYPQTTRWTLGLQLTF